jgi:flagellar basal body-associated protein FliL
MFETDLQDEEIKKKKRRVLIVLLVLLLGTAAALPLVGVTGVPLAAAPEPTPELPTHTAAPTDAPVPTDTPVPPTHEPTETSAPTTTPRPTVTSTPIPVPPTATEELPGGAGGGEPEASPAPTGAPTDTPVPPTPAPKEPGELPITGASADGFGRLAVGLATFSVGALMLAVGLAMRGGEMSATTPSRPAPTVADAQAAQERSEQLSGAGTLVWLALGLAAVVLVLVFIAGYTLRRTRRQ